MEQRCRRLAERLGEPGTSLLLSPLGNALILAENYAVKLLRLDSNEVLVAVGALHLAIVVAIILSTVSST